MGNRVYKSSMEAAIYAYHDAADTDRCVLLAKEIENFRVAAKYLEVAKNPDEAKAIWEVVDARESEERERIKEKGASAREEAEDLLTNHKPLEAALVLTKKDLLSEAADILRGESDLKSVLFLTRLLQLLRMYILKLQGQ